MICNSSLYHRTDGITVTTDYVTGLPENENGHDAMAILFDKLTKKVYLTPCKTTSDGQDWADMFMDSMYVNQGTTEHILFDRGEFDQGLLDFWASPGI